MGYDQVFSALQTGVIDGAENNPPSFVFDNHYQVAKYFTFTEHLIVPEILVMSRKAWDALSKDDQALVKKFAREAQLEERELWKAYEAKALDKAKAAGIQFTQIADKAPFQAAVKPVWDKYGRRASPTPSSASRRCSDHGGKHGVRSPPHDGCSLLDLRGARLHRAGADLRGHPVGGVHPQGAQQRCVVAGAVRGAAHHRTHLLRQARPATDAAPTWRASRPSPACCRTPCARWST